ncbi:MAG TPA: hypothetical protein VMU27_03315, partial [Candidatus Paceibacterota bacterium]|nr:hypothetical protein [Candidatus Paceibacterota bacterium]
YLSSASFYLSGLVVLIDALLPVVFLYTGLVPVRVSGMVLAGVFLPYFFFTMYTIERASNYTFTFSSLCFSMGSFAIQLRALGSAVIGARTRFEVTNKHGSHRSNNLSLIKWHVVYIALVVAGIPIAFAREGMSASLVNNAAWTLLNITFFLPFIRASLPVASHSLARAELVKNEPEIQDDSASESVFVTQ